MSSIVRITAREILDSRGNPTVEADVHLSDGTIGRAAVPSGASTGEHEAVELRDGDADRFLGKGVRKAVAHVNGEIAGSLTGMAADPHEIDGELIALDGTPNKSRLGANATLAVSMAVARASASHRGIELFESFGGEAHTLPVPMMNILNGGAHANNSVDIQEFMVMPIGFDRFSDALRAGVEVFHALRRRAGNAGYSTAVGDEGGIAPDLSSNREALELIMASIDDAGYAAGDEIVIALDCAASELYDAASGEYRLESAGEAGTRAADGMAELYAEWSRSYPIVSIEDGLDEDDWDGWAGLTVRLGESVQLVGDDLFVTNVTRLSRGIEEAVGNAILIKLNQIGTVSETLQAIRLAQSAGFGVVISHRSGETCDTFISDLAVATDAGQIKTGSACRSDRVAKYNRLLRIEEALGDRARYPGRAALERG